MVGNADLLDLYLSLRRSVALEANQSCKEIGLGNRQFLILWSLSQKPRMTVGELVEAAMTDASTISRSLVQLVDNGYVVKDRCPKDGRVWFVRLAPKGKSLIPKMDLLYRRLADRCFSGLQSKDKALLAGTLRKVIEGLGSQNEFRSVEEEL